MVGVRLENVVKRYGATRAVDNITLEIKPGELFTFLGPSGCGKTTTLRLIAGFEYPDEGTIYFDGRDVTTLKPYERNTAMVFQNYALWPHMTVFDNIAYGLKVRKFPQNEIRERVRRVLDLVKLRGMEKRYPSQLSGGQQQRVALARALVVEPDVLLLDEPLSNLDAKLRIEMREEIRKIQRHLGITAIYVTHDQEEAMSISDRIAVMDKGKVLQVDTPETIYFRPRNFFVATFIGKTSVVEGEVVGREDGYILARIAGDKMVKAVNAEGDKAEQGDRVWIVLRPEYFDTEEELGINRFEGRVEMAMFLGSHRLIKLALSPSTIISAYLKPDRKVKVGDKLTLFVEPDKTLAYLKTAKP